MNMHPEFSIWSVIGFGSILVYVFMDLMRKRLAFIKAQSSAELVESPAQALSVPGLESLEQDATQVKRLTALRKDIRAVYDLRVFTSAGELGFADAPQAVRETLSSAYSGGKVLGASLPALVSGTQKLKEGEKVYFALVSLGAEPEVICFN